MNKTLLEGAAHTVCNHNSLPGMVIHANVTQITMMTNMGWDQEQQQQQQQQQRHFVPSQLPKTISMVSLPSNDHSVNANEDYYDDEDDEWNSEDEEAAAAPYPGDEFDHDDESIDSLDSYGSSIHSANSSISSSSLVSMSMAEKRSTNHVLAWMKQRANLEQSATTATTSTTTTSTTTTTTSATPKRNHDTMMMMTMMMSKQELMAALQVEKYLQTKRRKQHLETRETIVLTKMMTKATVETPAGTTTTITKTTVTPQLL
jgi:hypothetical protein